MSTFPESALHDDGFLRRAAFALLRDHADADDVAQDARAAGLKAGVPEGARSWMGVVARRLAAKRRVADARRGRREEAAAKKEATPSVADVVAREELRRRVVEAVFGLPDDRRDVVLLRWYEDLPPRKAAARLGVPVETFRTRLKRAHAELRERLDREHGGARAAWAAPLASFAGVAPTGAGVESTTWIEGVLMTTKTKAATAVVAAALIGVAAWMTLDDGGRAPSAPSFGGAGSASHATGNEKRPPSDASSTPTPVDKEAFVEPDEGALLEAKADAFGRLTVRLVWDRDGSPAAGVAAYVVAGRGTSDRFLSASLDAAVSNAEGLLPTRAVPAGSVGVYTDRDGSAWCDVAAGGETTCEVRLSGGADTSVRVVDSFDRPIEGADVWLSFGGVGAEGAVVASTDARGTALLRGVPSWSIVAIRKRGFEPSLAHQVRGEPGDSVELSFRLVEGGGAMRGTVRFADGRPAKGVAVRVGPFNLATVESPGVVTTDVPPPRFAFVDAEGAFGFEGLPSGPQPVRVLSRTAPQRDDVVAIPKDGELRRDIVLSAAATIRGRVIDAAGVPAAKVWVSAGTPARSGDVVGRAFLTASDGGFELGGLAAGPTILRASAGDRGSAEAALDLRAGAVVETTLRLDHKSTLIGRVVEADGAPAAEVAVAVSRRGTDGIFRHVAETHLRRESGGRFVFNLDDVAPVRVEVKSFLDQTLVALDDAAPGEREIELRIPVDARPSAFVVGKLVDAAGAPVRGGHVIVWDEARSIGHGLKADAEGAFRSEALLPGSYRIDAESPEGPTLSLGLRTLARGETLDLGVVRFEAPGSLVAVIRMRNGAVASGGIVFLRHEAGGNAKFEQQGGVVRATLAPGAYVLVVDPSDGAHAPIVRRFTITPALETTIDATHERGVPVQVVVERDETPRPHDTPMIDVDVRDASGVELASYGMASGGTLRLSLLPGRYVVGARDTLGRKAEESFDVPSSGAPEPQVVLRLR